MRNELTGWHVASIMAPVDETVNGKYRYRGWTPCIKWCKEQFGGSGYSDTPSPWRFQGEGVFEFKEQADYLLFTLTWGK